MEKLTLQQLAVYLPYSLSLRDKSGDIWHMQIDPILPFEITIKGVLDKNMTPILYQISCLTKEITHNGKTFVPIVELLKPHINIHKPKNLTWIGDSIVYESLVLMQTKNLYLRPEQYQKLAEWHINFLNIPDSLFIDKSTLK